MPTPDCGFCSDVVNLFINFDGDPRGAFRFASLQGEIGQELLTANGLDTEHFNTIVLVDKDEVGGADGPWGGGAPALPPFLLLCLPHSMDFESRSGHVVLSSY